MMKLSVEIKEERFIYKYEVGSSNGESSNVIDPDFLCAFTSLLRFCSEQSRRDRKDFMRSIEAKAWIEKNKDEAQSFMGKLNEK